MWVFEVGFVLFALGFAAEGLRRWWRYPKAPCRWCGGSGKAYQPGNRKFHGACRHCGETGTRKRAGAKFLDKWSGRRDER
jgi:hypothetical protein